jgi:hypothetical protein
VLLIALYLTLEIAIARKMTETMQYGYSAFRTLHGKKFNFVYKENKLKL